MSGAADAARLLRERAASYARDAERLAHDGPHSATTTQDIVILITIRDALRNVANEMEALGQCCGMDVDSDGRCIHRPSHQQSAVIQEEKP